MAKLPRSPVFKQIAAASANPPYESPSSSFGINHPLGARQPAEAAVYDDAVEAVLDEGQQVAKQLGEQFQGKSHMTRSGWKSRQVWRRIVEGTSVQLIDEVRYIQLHAAHHDGRIVIIGQLVLFSADTDDAWLLDRSDRLAARLARNGETEAVHIEETDTAFTIGWKSRYRLVYSFLLSRGISWSSMRILFTFENPLPSTEADAEVFMATARCLAPFTSQSSMHVPIPGGAGCDAIGTLAGMPIVRAYAPVRPAALRHLSCGATLVFRKEFWQADLVYTRNLWVAWLAVLFGQQVVFDHYRPWPDQIPPLQSWIYRLICHRRFLANICHSNYTRQKYLDLGIPKDKLHCVRNGFEPQRLQAPVPIETAKQRLGLAADQKTVVYTGRINHKKGLNLMVEAAKKLPDLLFLLVGSYGEGPIETMASAVANVRVIPWQPPEALGNYVFAADVLLIPPSWRPLAEFGSTVLPLKLFFYMASGRPIVAGDTPDVREVLKHEENAFLCRPDCLESLVGGIRALTDDPKRAARLAATALAGSRDFTWDTRARKIAGIIASRSRSAPAERGVWSRAQFCAWMRQSRRWLVHLIRTRSWVLPPHAVLPAASLPAEESE